MKYRSILLYVLTVMAFMISGATPRRSMCSPIQIETVTDTSAPKIRLVEMRCEYRKNPQGIDILHPRFSWKVETNQPNYYQSAYQIEVYSDTRMEWNSGKIQSSHSVHQVYGGAPLMANTDYRWRVCLWDQHGKKTPWSEFARFSTGLLTPDAWKAKWIAAASDIPREELSEAEKAVMDPDSLRLPSPLLLRKTFLLPKSVKRAVIYATALGLYEMELNGKPVSTQKLAPEWTDYNKRVQYQAYNVTEFLKRGENVIGVHLGNGWYCGNWQFWRSHLRPIYGNSPCFLMQMEIEFSDGTKDVVLTDESWRVTAKGPIRFSGLYEGETVDARRFLPGWSNTGFNDASWDNVIIPKKLHHGKFVWQRSEPISITQWVKAVSVTQPRDGITVVDFGQNLSGYCRFKFRGTPGQVITVRYNELLNLDGTVYMDNLHAGNLSQGRRQIDQFICSGNEDVFLPRFTLHGFRYAEISGMNHPGELLEVQAAVVHTQFEKTGCFESSDKLLNRLFLNIIWSQRSNMAGIPTDCCQRDERCGYTGDMAFFLPTAVYNYDMAAFSNKWLVDLCQDSQLPDGHFADHAPTYGPGNKWNIGWGDAAIECPFTIWQSYADTRVISEHFSAMEKYLALLDRHLKNGILNINIGNGDWLNKGGGACSQVIATAYAANNFRLMALMADAIGETQKSIQYNKKFEDIKSAFRMAFIKPDGTILNSSQTGYALAYTMNLIPDNLNEAVGKQFAREIERFNDHLATGFIGTPRLLPALHLAHRDDLAYKLLFCKTAPSWMYPVTVGATTIWERWDGWTPGKPLGKQSMNSFNHYAFGACGRYFYENIGGITPLEPGFKKFRIAPIPGEPLLWADVSYHSPYGKIRSRWKIENGLFSLQVEIPPNTTAEILLPGERIPIIRGSGKYILTKKYGP